MHALVWCLYMCAFVIMMKKLQSVRTACSPMATPHVHEVCLQPSSTQQLKMIEQHNLECYVAGLYLPTSTMEYLNPICGNIGAGQTTSFSSLFLVCMLITYIPIGFWGRMLPDSVKILQPMHELLLCVWINTHYHKKVRCSSLFASSGVSPLCYWHDYCQTQLLAIIAWAQSLNDQTTTRAVFLDFSKAFDTVPHKKLLLNLDHIGIQDKVLKWIQAFLCHRHQRVVINGDSLAWLPVTSGVPQGSVLGPLLFLLYINDLADNLDSDCRLFADDITLYRRITSLYDCAKLQADLSKLCRWTQRWQPHLNISKCKVLCIFNKRAPPYMVYTINNATLEWVNSHKYLGIRITSYLRWSKQCRDAASKAIEILSLLRRTMHGTNTEAEKRAFVMLVRPLLEYMRPQCGLPMYRGTLRPLSMCREELPIGYAPSGTGPTGNEARHRLGRSWAGLRSVIATHFLPSVRYSRSFIP